MEAATHLRAVTTNDLLVNPATGEPTDVSYRIQDLEDQLKGYRATCDKQARQIGALTRRLDAIEDPDHQPANSEVIALIERWRTRHSKATISRDRVKLVKARLADGFPLSSDEELPDFPTLELAVDGVLAMPFLVFGKRRRDGAKSNRYSDLKDALGDAAKVEESARAGYLARKEGWTLENGWPCNQAPKEAK